MAPCPASLVRDAVRLVEKVDLIFAGGRVYTGTFDVQKSVTEPRRTRKEYTGSTCISAQTGTKKGTTLLFFKVFRF